MLKKLILVLNYGSSSLKFSIIDISSNIELVVGIVENLHLPEVRIKWKIFGLEHTSVLCSKNIHYEILIFIKNIILIQNLKTYTPLVAIGHRIVHGGEQFTKSVIIDDNVIQGIKNAISFAPLHNPSHLLGIDAAFQEFPYLKKKNIAVFDTAFHQTLSEEAYLYAIPYSLYKKYSIRRYGAHGISHHYVSLKTAEFLNKSISELNIITCHLGNGSSISAICNGKCVDTSMGLTPLEGLVMGTRSGDIDPSIIFYLYNIVKLPIDDIHELLTQKSGLLGLTEITHDCRYLENHYYDKIEAKRAINIYCHRLAKYISAYSSLMDGKLDAVVFTGGIGENSAIIRELSLKKLSLLNFEVNHELNLATRFGRHGVITTDTSRPAIVIITNEALIIAQDTIRLIT